MKSCLSKIIAFFVIAGIMQIYDFNHIYAQGLTIEEIQTNLLNNPPNIGDSTVREQTILKLDSLLETYPVTVVPGIEDFYAFMMEKIKAELKHSVDSETIWMMYNHGFIVQTEQLVFAFDLIPAYLHWPSSYLPDEIINKVKILFISHEHQDHYNFNVKNKILANGGYVVVPSERPSLGNIPMAPGDSITLMGLKIKAHYGLHSVPVRIFEVTTPNGLKILHTGDNQTSTTLPNVDSVDVLLLNAWVNESGTVSPVIGMRNCINVIKPKLMIPGHMQELGHPPSIRIGNYRDAFEVDDIPIPSEVKVMAWGERFIVSDKYNKLFVYGGNLSSAFIRVNIDTLTILSEIYNPENRNLQVDAIIASVDNTSEDSITLYDDGNHNDSLANDGIWGNRLLPVLTENEFVTTVNMVDLDSGVYFILNDMARFTSIGPVVVDTFKQVDHVGDHFIYQIVLKNDGLYTTAENVALDLLTDNPYVTMISNNSQNFGNIAPGQSVISPYFYAVSTSNLPLTHKLDFQYKIFSNNYLFWEGNIDVIVELSEANQNIPKSFYLYQNNPNPFNPGTNIKFSIPKSEKVKIEVFNLLGQKIETLINKQMPSGSHVVEFSAKNLPSGLYLYRIVVDSPRESFVTYGEAGEFTEVKKMILLK